MTPLMLQTATPLILLSPPRPCCRLKNETSSYVYIDESKGRILLADERLSLRIT